MIFEEMDHGMNKKRQVMKWSGNEVEYVERFKYFRICSIEGWLFEADEKESM